MALLKASATDLIPDWKQLWTIQEAEKELSINLRTNGQQIDGWHLFKDDTLLVIPSEVEGKYWFWVYNNRNPAEHFNAIVNAATRTDER